VAAYVSAGLSASLPQLLSSLGAKPRDSFELGFNRATGLAALGDLPAAEAAVKAAYKQGESSVGLSTDCGSRGEAGGRRGWRHGQDRVGAYLWASLHSASACAEHVHPDTSNLDNCMARDACAQQVKRCCWMMS
jgi:hypothetical protein